MYFLLFFLHFADFKNWNLVLGIWCFHLIYFNLKLVFTTIASFTTNGRGIIS